MASETLGGTGPRLKKNKTKPGVRSSQRSLLGPGAFAPEAVRLGRGASWREKREPTVLHTDREKRRGRGADYEGSKARGKTASTKQSQRGPGTGCQRCEHLKQEEPEHSFPWSHLTAWQPSCWGSILPASLFLSLPSFRGSSWVCDSTVLLFSSCLGGHPNSVTITESLFSVPQTLVNRGLWPQLSSLFLSTPPSLSLP